MRASIIECLLKHKRMNKERLSIAFYWDEKRASRYDIQMVFAVREIFNAIIPLFDVTKQVVNDMVGHHRCDVFATSRDSISFAIPSSSI